VALPQGVHADEFISIHAPKNSRINNLKCKALQDISKGHRKYSAAMFCLRWALEALCKDYIASLVKCNNKKSITAVVRKVNIQNAENICL
jgi:hypothetical protein